MKRFLHFTFLVSLVSILAFSCGSEGEKEGKLRSGPLVAGKIGEILVVCDQVIWDSDTKKYLDTNLTQFIMPYFPDVVTFELIHKTPQRFEHAYKRHRNLLFINIDPAHTGDKARIQKKPDMYAIGQMVVEITGKDYNQVLEACKYATDEIHKIYDEAEWRRIIAIYQDQKTGSVKSLIKKVHSKFGLSLELPAQSKIFNERDSFMVITFPSAFRPMEYVGTGHQEAGVVFSGIMIYSTPYLDSTDLSMGCLLDRRDTILKRYVPSEVEGMYMGTQYNKLVYPESSLSPNADSTITGREVRGMFMFTGRPKFSTGGCFWSYSFLHPDKKKVITISGFVDAPSTTSWTHFLREIQAIWKSTKIN